MRLLKAVCVLTLLMFCCITIPACSHAGSDDVSYSQIATQFRAAMNDNDITGLVKLIHLPFSVVEQEWVSAQDGSGFVLGDRNELRLDKVDKLTAFLETFSPRVTIAGQQAMPVALSEYENFETELADAITQWRTLKTYLFKHGEGDVEHIVLLGINPQSRKVQAIYIN